MDAERKLSLEKTAIGFFLTAHLFDEAESEVRRFARQRIGDEDSRDPQVVAGIISDLRVINGTRGRVAIFKVDDKSETIEAVANQGNAGCQQGPPQRRRTGHHSGQRCKPTVSQVACA